MRARLVYEPDSTHLTVCRLRVSRFFSANPKSLKPSSASGRSCVKSKITKVGSLCSRWLLYLRPHDCNVLVSCSRQLGPTQTTRTRRVLQSFTSPGIDSNLMTCPKTFSGCHSSCGYFCHNLSSLVRRALAKLTATSLLPSVQWQTRGLPRRIDRPPCGVENKQRNCKLSIEC